LENDSQILVTETINDWIANLKVSPMTLPRHTIALVYLLVGAHALISFPRVSQHHRRKKPALFAQSNSDKSMSDGQSRRRFVNGISISAMGSFSSGFPHPAQASGAKSRTDGYAVQKSKDEWTSILTPLQFDILRKGGTERSYSSILEGEERLGVYSCAGCGTELFVASEKFHSGTGWPSFASAVEGVEVEKVNSLQANLAGAEVRCVTCGGKLFQNVVQWLHKKGSNYESFFLWSSCRTSRRCLQ
jgi:peptide-methionine (R)-S-oxide reductase